MPTKTTINEKHYQFLQKPFKISSVCREDIVSLGKQLKKEYSNEFIKSIDDGQMRYIAEKISDACQDTYWIALEMLCDDLLKDYREIEK